MSEHTPGKLELKVNRGGNEMFSCDLIGRVLPTRTGIIADTFNCDCVLSGEDQHANARRLVACWNRLATFSTEEIEQGIDLSPLQTELEASLKSNAELLASLKRLTDVLAERPSRAFPKKDREAEIQAAWLQGIEAIADAEKAGRA